MMNTKINPLALLAFRWLIHAKKRLGAGGQVEPVALYWLLSLSLKCAPISSIPWFNSGCLYGHPIAKLTHGSLDACPYLIRRPIGSPHELGFNKRLYCFVVPSSISFMRTTHKVWCGCSLSRRRNHKASSSGSPFRLALFNIGQGSRPALITLLISLEHTNNNKQ